MLAGDLAGLAAAGSSVPASLPLALAGVALLLAAVLRGGLPTRPSAPSAAPAAYAGASSGAGPSTAAARLPLTLLLAVCLAAGASAGLRAGRSAGSACTARLVSGQAVEARGVAGRSLGATAGVAGSTARAVRPGRGRRRLELHEVEIRAEGRSCVVPRLTARVPAPAAEFDAGTRVEVRGRWWAWRRGGPPRPPERRGFLRGEEVRAATGAEGAAAGAGDDPDRPSGARTGARAGGGAGWRLALRSAAAGRLAARLPPDVAPVAVALTLADRSGLDPVVSRRFADAGLAHLLAVSGLHVGLLGGALLWILARVVPSAGPRHALAAVLIGGYVLLLGVPASAFRAGLLFAGWCAARVRGSPVRVTELLGAAAAAGVLADPLAPLGPGFQLSFGGFSGLLLGDALARRGLEAARRRGRLRGRRIGRMVRAVAAGAGAVLLTAPAAAAHFGRTAPVAVASNFVGVPLTGLALAGLGGALSLPGLAGSLAGEGAAGALRLLLRAVDLFARVPGGHAAVVAPSPAFWPAAALVLVAAVRVAAGAALRRAALPLGAGAALGLAGPSLLAMGSGGHALLCQLDVGQGDAAVVRTRGGHWIVLDAGPGGRGRDAGREVVVPFLRARGARSVELLVLSHPHLDHVGGMTSLLQGLPVERILDAGNPLPSRPYADVLDAVEEEAGDWLPARAGDRLRVDGVEVLVLAPAGRADGRPRWEAEPEDANEASVAVRVRLAPGFAYLNTGDAGVAEEAGILARWPADSVRGIVMKAGHHGSRTSGSTAWLAAVRPRLVVVSAGAGNRYGHPHPEALERLREADIERVWRTDRAGTLCLEVRADGRWRVRGEERWRTPHGRTAHGRTPGPGAAAPGRSDAASAGEPGARPPAEPDPPDGARSRTHLHPTGRRPWTGPSSR